MVLLFLLACTQPGSLSESVLSPPRPADPVVVTWPSGSSDSDPTVATATPEMPRAVDVQLNEVCARNSAVLMDGAGETDDWLELVNRTVAPIQLADWILEDSGTRWVLPDLTIPAGGHQLLWLDGDLDQGSDHAPFSVSSAGETLSLSRPDGSLADRLHVPELEEDLVFGRFPDGGSLGVSMVPTPGNRNPAWPTPGGDASVFLFPEDDLLVVELYLPESSEEALRTDDDARVPGSLAIDGVWLDDVQVRIKGQLGSRRSYDEKAAFKVDLNALVDGQRRLRGLEMLTLNNMVQDASTVHELVGYALARDLGIPAPRVAHTLLYVNDAYRGVYLHVETMDDRFLERWFDDPDGNLYEGAYGVDLYPEHIWRFEHDEEGSDDVDDRSDLLALAELLALPPSEDRVADLEALVDVDLTARVMAWEAVIGHWDGYFHFANNYRLYHEPSTGRFTLLPWGIDQTFSWWLDVMAPGAHLSEWMLDIPSVRARYEREVVVVAEALAARDVATEAGAAQERVLPWYEADPYRERSVDDLIWGVDETIGFSRGRPLELLEDLAE